jgi:hypothetical protein
MSGIKIKNSGEIKDIFMKNRFPNYLAVASLLDFLVHKKFTLTLL